MEEESKSANGEVNQKEEVMYDTGTKNSHHHQLEEDDLFRIISGLLWSIFCPDHTSSLAGIPILYRVKTSLREDLPRLRGASKNSGLKILRWTRRGSPLRALLVISVGASTFLTLTGLLVFTIFFVAATFNAIMISLLMSLAAAGGFLAIFFTCLTAIYVGALSVAIFVISTATIISVIAALVATGWIGFLWTMWLAAKKSAGLAKRSVGFTGSALSAYSVALSARRRSHRDD